jgi:hypothetical protein
VGTK